ncbi:MAG: DegT/DnrJ/EryC1/StrS family aminotransferase [Planctomycetes bacterium]|nr:DegT/DnrJ/EryC1/StrS family aminotransferase [Planctomycetota bacterium]
MYRHGREEIEAVTKVLANGQWFRYGDAAAGHLGEAARFEREYAEAMRSPHVGMVSSGTAALMCCYAGLALGPGDEVIIPGYTWIASALAPLHHGVIPVIVDIDESLTLDPAAVERAITPRTRAINPVHMNGLACDMDALREIASRRGLVLIEDACQADGGRWTGAERLGALGEMGAYSFNFYKMISCGDGGAFAARSREHYERALMFHDGGCIFRPHAKELGIEFFCGINLRGNEILAAILRVQLARLDAILDDLHRVRRRVLAVIRSEGLELVPLRGSDATGTASHLGVRFAHADDAAGFCRSLPTLSGGTASAHRPIDSGRHVYRNWEPVMAQRGAYAQAADPFHHPANATALPAYHPDMLPRTLDLLARTALIALHPDQEDATADALGAAIAASARQPAHA